MNVQDNNNNNKNKNNNTFDWAIENVENNKNDKIEVDQKKHDDPIGKLLKKDVSLWRLWVVPAILGTGTAIVLGVHFKAAIIAGVKAAIAGIKGAVLALAHSKAALLFTFFSIAMPHTLVVIMIVCAALILATIVIGGCIAIKYPNKGNEVLIVDK